MFRLLTLASLCVAALSPPGTTQTLDNAGKDFVLAYLPNTAGGPPDVELHLTSSVATTVSVEYPMNAPTFTMSVAVVPGTISVVSLPIEASGDWLPDSVAGNLVRAYSDEEFVAYTITRRQFTSDAALALPVDTMNTEYIQIDYTPPSSFAPFGGELIVVAAFDNTTVTITPAANMIGHVAGMPFDVVLNAGEGYFGKSTGVTTGLTGTMISSDRPVGMVNGNHATNVPSGTSFADHIFEIAQPVQTWGMDVLAADLPQRPGGSVYRIVASEDGTTVQQNGANIGILNAGEFLEVGPVAGSQRFTADQPIFACQFMTGSSSPGATAGDPAQGNLIPSAQYLENYTFSTVGGAQFANHFLTIIAADTDVGTLTLDGTPVPSTEFTPIAGSGFSSANVPLAVGSHSTSAVNGHGILVSGYNQDDSYLFPGGARFDFINSAGDSNPPLCDVSVGPDGTTAIGTLRDDRPSEDTNGNGVLDPGEDQNGNGLIDEDTGIFFAQVDPGATNLTIQIDPFTPGDPSIGFSAALTSPTQPGSAVVRITDGAGNVTLCPVDLDGVFHTYCFGDVCPCGNDDPDAGCANSTGMGALLGASGSSSVAADDLTLTVTQLPANRFGILYYGPTAICGPFGDGLRAVAPGPPGMFARLPHRNSGGSGSFSEGPGLISARGFQAGTTVNFQVMYRDKDGPCSTGFNLTNALSVSFLP